MMVMVMVMLMIHVIKKHGDMVIRIELTQSEPCQAGFL